MRTLVLMLALFSFPVFLGSCTVVTTPSDGIRTVTYTPRDGYPAYYWGTRYYPQYQYYRTYGTRYYSRYGSTRYDGARYYSGWRYRGSRGYHRSWRRW